MTVDSQKLFAVVTADLVKSSSVPGAQRERLHAAIEEGANRVQEHFQASLPYPIGIFRGDSWQAVVEKPYRAVRIGLFLRAYVIARTKEPRVDTRFAVGVGTIDFLPTPNVMAGDGPAFRRSGLALGDIKRGTGIRLELPRTRQDESYPVILGLVDALARRWTDKQAMAVCGKLHGLDQKQIAKRWGTPIRWQTVGEHLRKAGWNDISGALKFLEHRLNDL